MSQLDLFSDSKNLTSTTDLALSSQLPDYRVRESKRAKHVSIKISVEGEVEIVIPPRFDSSKLPDILEKRRAWIIKTRAKLLRDRAKTADSWQADKPDKILFRWRSDHVDDPSNGPDAPKGFGTLSQHAEIETWAVKYQPTPGDKLLCIPEDNNHLVVRGNTAHLPSCQAVLRQWLAHRAQRDLGPWLRQLGFDLELPCRRISVRGQKTRWASCSSQKDISLNFKLLFLPRPLVKYVLVHELCHTVHMNHSADFWALVGEKMPNYKPWKQRLKTGWQYVPRWVESK